MKNIIVRCEDDLVEGYTSKIGMPSLHRDAPWGDWVVIDVDHSWNLCINGRVTPLFLLAHIGEQPRWWPASLCYVVSTDNNGQEN